MEYLIQELGKINKDKVVIKIDGRGGSGKTTVAKELSKLLPSSEVINLDNYTLNSVDLFDISNIEKHFDIDFSKTKYDQESIAEIINNSEAKYLIVEGCFCFRNTSNLMADYLVWVEIPKSTAAMRLNTRERNDPSRAKIATEVIELSTQKWQESEDKYIAEFNPSKAADYVVYSGIPLNTQN